jgi:hypothetical protein
VSSVRVPGEVGRGIGDQSPVPLRDRVGPLTLAFHIVIHTLCTNAGTTTAIVCIAGTRTGGQCERDEVTSGGTSGVGWKNVCGMSNKGRAVNVATPFGAPQPIRDTFPRRSACRLDSRRATDPRR